MILAPIIQVNSCKLKFEEPYMFVFHMCRQCAVHCLSESRNDFLLAVLAAA